mgnify:CR=1 FL=1
MREDRPAASVGAGSVGMGGPSTVAIGIDVGGTFTDLVALHADGRVQAGKVGRGAAGAQ